MWRNETNADRKKQEAKVQQEYAKQFNSNQYLKSLGYQQAHNCYCSEEHKVTPNYKITDEIIREREAAANEVLDAFHLHTRVNEQPMLDVFQHPIIEELEEKQEAHLAGGTKSTRAAVSAVYYEL